MEKGIAGGSYCPLVSRNVVLVVLDSVRKDRFDALATQLSERAAVTYTGCRAAGSWSVPSHASMLTGQLPTECGVHAHAVDYTGLDRSDTVLGSLPDHHAIGVSTNVFAGSSYGFDHLFDEFASFSRHSRYPRALNVDDFLQHTDASGWRRYPAYLRAVSRHDHPVASVADGLGIKLLDALEPLPVQRPWDYGAATIRRESVRRLHDAPEPVFLFTNFMEAHTPHQQFRGCDRSLHDAPDGWTTAVDLWEVNTADDLAPYEEYLDRFRGLYDASVDYLDRAVSSFVDAVQAVTDRETTVVVTADHGENLCYPAEDGLLGHTASLSEALLHVPLLVLNAPGEVSDRVERGYVSHLDLPELLVGLAAGKFPSLPRERVVAERVGLGLVEGIENFDYYDRMLRVAYRGTEKYGWDSLGGSYRATVDPEDPSTEERTATDVNVPGWATDRFPVDIETAKRQAEAAGSGRDVDDATADRLADLGYL